MINMSDFQFFRPPKSIDQVLEKLKAKPASYWEKQGESAILSLFALQYKPFQPTKNSFKLITFNTKGSKHLKISHAFPLSTKTHISEQTIISICSRIAVYDRSLLSARPRVRRVSRFISLAKNSMILNTNMSQKFFSKTSSESTNETP